MSALDRVVRWDDVTGAEAMPGTVLAVSGVVCWLLPTVEPWRLVGSALVVIGLGTLLVARLRNGTAPQARRGLVTVGGLCGFAVVVGNGVVAFLSVTRATSLGTAFELVGLVAAAVLTAGGLVGGIGYLVVRTEE